MLTVYTWPTPNGHKVHIMLEECGFRLGHDWQAETVNMGTGEQFKPEFLAISPNNKIPALMPLTGPTIRTFKPDSTQSPPDRRCSAASRCWPTCAGPSPMTRHAR